MTPVDIVAELAVAANGTPSVDARVSAGSGCDDYWSEKGAGSIAILNLKGGSRWLARFFI